VGKETKLAKYLNELTEAVLLFMYKQVALDLFTWSNLPEGVTTDILEGYLYEHGKVIWAKAEDNGPLIPLPGTATGERTILNQPVAWNRRGFNYNDTVQVEKAVRMKNNPLMVPTCQTINYYVIKLKEIERTIDNHVKAHKVARVMTGDADTLLSVKNMLDKVDENEVNIIINKFLNKEDLDVLDLEMTFIADKLKDLSNEIKNDLNTFLGINNANTDKKERLVTDEVTANDDAIERNIAYMLRSRKEAVEAINTMFSTNIMVEVAHQSTAVDKSEDKTEDDEEDEDDLD